MSKVPLSSQTSPVWTLKPHTAAKHQLLRSYLGAWFPILASWNRRIVFIDGFAGPGVYDDGEPGSPILALRALLDHSHFASMANTEFVFVFVEMDTQRFVSLQSELSAEEARRGAWPSNVIVESRNSNFREVASEILASIEDKSLAPTFAFLDPFGYKDLPIELVADLLKFDKSELFVYFDFNSVSRFGSAGIVDDRLRDLFGTEDFKSIPPAGDSGRHQFIHDLYVRQLKEVCGFRFVQGFRMITANGKTSHYLFYCSKHLKGFDSMKSAMWKVAPAGNYEYRDEFAGMEVLFTPSVDTTPLQEVLSSEFCGQTLDIQTVVDYVVGHTPYVSAHVKTKTLKPMQKAGKISVPGQRRQGTYPPGTKITFV